MYILVREILVFNLPPQSISAKDLPLPLSPSLPLSLSPALSLSLSLSLSVSSWVAFSSVVKRLSGFDRDMQGTP